VGVHDSLAHEVIHQFQDYSLPMQFLEIAARYYQRHTTDSLRWGHIKELKIDDSLEVYGQLIDAYGDDVHALFFGKPMDNDLAGEIIAKAYDLAARCPSLADIARH
jgi:hypothetical protein